MHELYYEYLRQLEDEIRLGVEGRWVTDIGACLVARKHAVVSTSGDSLFL